MQGGTRPARRAAGIGMLLAVTVLGAALAGPWRPPLSEDRSWVWVPLPEAPPVPPAPAPHLTDAVRRTFDLGPLAAWPWVAAVLLGLALLLLLLLLVAVLVPRLRRFALDLLRRRRAGRIADGADVGLAGALAGADDPDLVTLTEGVEQARAAVRRRHPRPSDAVLAAWVALEQAAERCGVERDPASTATEFTVDVLGRTPADGAATRDLLALYLRARFGGAPLTAADVTAAHEALATLQAGLTGGLTGARA